MTGLPQAKAWGIWKLLTSGWEHATGFSLWWGALWQRADRVVRPYNVRANRCVGPSFNLSSDQFIFKVR